MRKVYICSPYRATDSAELDRNIEYAQQLTKHALKVGLAPITPHLYLTQCTNEDKPEERAAGLAAGIALLKCCDFVIAGTKYGVSEGMEKEIETAAIMGISVIDALHLDRKHADGIRARNNKNGINAHNAYITTQSGLTAHTVTYDESYGLEQQLIKGKQQREAKQKQHRKGIYETICRKTEKNQ